MATKKKNTGGNRTGNMAGWSAAISGIVGLALGYFAIWAPGDLPTKLAVTAILTAVVFVVSLIIWDMEYVE